MEPAAKPSPIEINERYFQRTGACCIYQVPQRIRRVNVEAYTPQLISIGPLHYSENELFKMDEEKERYMRSFSERTTREKMDEISNFVINKEEDIRNCYSESSWLASPRFTKMILHDAIFIIELFVRNYKQEEDFLLDMPGTNAALFLDLLLLENQLPFFVLQEICNLAIIEPTFMELTSKFFRRHSWFDMLPVRVVEIKHFTDLARSAVLKQHNGVNAGKSIADLPSAVKLSESGVKFKHNVGEKCLLNVRFEKVMCLCRLKAAELQIPNLKLYDDTELLLQNMMAFEQCHHRPRDNLVCSYIDFINSLINAEKDVDLLVEKRIITNCMGDSASVKEMFNRLCTHIVVSKSAYYGICQKLKEHYHNRWNHLLATLVSVYFTDLWTGTATVAATLILVFTIISAICSIVQVS